MDVKVRGGSIVRNLLPVTADRTSPAAPGHFETTVQTGMFDFSGYTFLADLQGATGGTLDVVIEHSPDGVNFYEFAHFAQLAAGAALSSLTVVKVPTTSVLFTVGKNLTTTTTLAASTVIAPPYFDTWRVRYVAGAGTSAGAPVSLSVLCWR